MNKGIGIAVVGALGVALASSYAKAGEKTPKRECLPEGPPGPPLYRGILDDGRLIVVLGPSQTIPVKAGERWQSVVQITGGTHAERAGAASYAKDTVARLIKQAGVATLESMSIVEEGESLIATSVVKVLEDYQLKITRTNIYPNSTPPDYGGAPITSCMLDVRKLT
jgi:hypothetical protein